MKYNGVVQYEQEYGAYDQIGNPLTWRNGAVFTWQGRQLQTATVNGKSLSYSYNADGIRTKKVVDGTATYYVLDGTKVVSQKTGTNDPVYFEYDATGKPVSMSYLGRVFYYVTNMQGDVIALVNSSGDKVAEYAYGPFGQVLSVTGSHAAGIGQINPLRYRGYYYDNETGLYYLNSRYYDPEVGRFINAGSVASSADGDILDYNVYAYCNNDSINLTVKNSSSSEQSTSACKTTNLDFYTFENPMLDTMVYYNVPLYNQNGYSLCWAFCQVMVEDYQAGRIRTNKQATERAISIARSVYGDNWNQSGWPTNSRDLFGDTGINSFDDLYNALVRNGPIYAYYGGTKGAHLVVVTGVNKTKGIVYTNNPWGIVGAQTYSQFLQGFAGMPNDWDMPFGFYILIQ